MTRKCGHRLNSGGKCRRQISGKGYCWQHGGYSSQYGGGLLEVQLPSRLAKPKKGQWSIYGSQRCPYTKNAFEILKQHLEQAMINQPARLVFYDLVNLNGRTLEDLRQYLKGKIGTHRTMPMIFNGTRFVGGYTQLMEEFS